MKKTILKYNQLPENQSKDKFLKEAKDKWHITFKKLRILINADFAFKTTEARGQYWGEKNKSCPSRIL